MAQLLIRRHRRPVELSPFCFRGLSHPVGAKRVLLIHAGRDGGAMASDAVCGAESRRQGRGAQQRAARASNGLVVVVWLSSQHQRGDDTGNGRCHGLVGPARCWVSLQALALYHCLLDLTCAGIIGCRTSRAVAVAKLGRLIAMMPASRKPLWWPLTTSSSALIMSDSSRT
jgi:hypothetical protein